MYMTDDISYATIVEYLYTGSLTVRVVVFRVQAIRLFLRTQRDGRGSSCLYLYDTCVRRIYDRPIVVVTCRVCE